MTLFFQPCWGIFLFINFQEKLFSVIQTTIIFFQKKELLTFTNCLKIKHCPTNNPLLNFIFNRIAAKTSRIMMKNIS